METIISTKDHLISAEINGNISKITRAFYNKAGHVSGYKTTFHSCDICDMHEVFVSVVLSIDRRIAEGFSIVEMDKTVGVHEGVTVTYVARRK